ncbi:MAG TPA: M4 family metallopeptidase, partial [Anaerolineae bacterium]|nr:M4 family metallopeptidase [Anaerolineae bacterium]
MKQTFHQAVLSLLLLFVLTAGTCLPAGAQEQGQPQIQASDAPQGAIERLRQETGEGLQISYHTQTGKVQYIGTDLDHPIALPAKAKLGSPEQAARQFLVQYGPLFGLRDQEQELEVMRTQTRDRGRTFVRFQQVHQGVPVFGGELIVQLDEGKNVLSVGGEILPALDLEPSPRISADEAQARALAVTAKSYGLPAEELVASKPELRVYNPILLQPGPDLDSLVWQVEVTAAGARPVRELVLVEAQVGLIALNFSQIDTARNRSIYDNSNNPAYGLPGYGPVRTEGQPATGNADVDAAYNYFGHTYDFYLARHGRDSIDGAGMALIGTVRYCPDSINCPYGNAFWNGQQMAFGVGYAAADDVVAHELTHGVTDHESHLFYYAQSGAINEAFSDLWGELVDLTNGAGDDTSGVRWLMGEDLPIGAIRDMSEPGDYEQPDSTDSYYYYCGPDDGAGVHINSGVGNKAAFLMVDGGSFGGYNVGALGIDKTADIWYEAQTNLLTSGADYSNLHDALLQACTNLIGTGGITAANCQEVGDAVNATKMGQPPSGCETIHLPLCNTGRPVALFSDDLENPASGKWTHGALSGADEWYYPPASNPYDFDSTYATSGRYNLWGYAQGATADTYMRMTSDVLLPQNTLLQFEHAYMFEANSFSNYDGGVLEYSTTGGTSWNDAGSLMVDNGYGGTLASSNPLGGRSAFVDTSYGYGSTRLDLSSLAGQNVRFRFRLGTDGSTDNFGWFIDDVRIYTCESADFSAYLPLVIRNHQSAPASGWVALVDERFEGTCPGAWTTTQDSIGGAYYWGKRTCRPFEGS